MAVLVSKYFPDLTEKQKEQFAQLQSLYIDWNSKINVISRKDLENFYVRHVLHSLGIAKVHQFEPGSTVVDVGTGGGFPGIPLAIMFPDSKFHLVDSIAKKINVVKAIASDVGLTNVTAEQARIEELNLQCDYVVSRAVARMISFYRWVEGQMKKGGSIYYLKGGDIQDEMQELKRPFEVFDLSDYYNEDFFETKKVVSVKK
jgi:16S rRNA (guanine527-N7)-methyltransferase